MTEWAWMLIIALAVVGVAAIVIFTFCLFQMLPTEEDMEQIEPHDER